MAWPEVILKDITQEEELNIQCSQIHSDIIEYEMKIAKYMTDFTKWGVAKYVRRILHNAGHYDEKKEYSDMYQQYMDRLYYIRAKYTTVHNMHYTMSDRYKLLKSNNNAPL